MPRCDGTPKPAQSLITVDKTSCSAIYALAALGCRTSLFTCAASTERRRIRLRGRLLVECARLAKPPLSHLVVTSRRHTLADEVPFFAVLHHRPGEKLVLEC